MSFQPSIPAQHLALSYVQEFMAAHSIPVWMGGHSKGGNLAVYAAAKVKRSKMNRVTSLFDEGNFTPEEIRDAVEKDKQEHNEK